jgi:hypothetical protein
MRVYYCVSFQHPDKTCYEGGELSVILYPRGTVCYVRRTGQSIVHTIAASTSQSMLVYLGKWHLTGS